MKVFNKLPLFFVLLVASIFTFASCSTNISDSSETNSRDALKISVVQKNDNASRDANAPFTVEVIISQDGTTIAKKSKDIAKESGATFEFSNLPYDVELNVELNIYIGSNKVATGSNTCTVIPNADNNVEITIERDRLRSATFAGSEADKVSAIIDFANNTGITISFTTKPNITNLLQSLSTASGTDSITLDFTNTGAITLTQQELLAIKNLSIAPNLDITLANNSTLQVTYNNKDALSNINCSRANITYCQSTCDNASFSSIMKAIKEANRLTNITLDLRNVSIQNSGDTSPSRKIPAVNSSNTPMNVISVNLDGIKEVEAEAFKEFSGLANTIITIPESVKKLGRNCFPATATLTVQGGNGTWIYTDENGNEATFPDEELKAKLVASEDIHRN